MPFRLLHNQSTLLCTLYSESHKLLSLLNLLYLLQLHQATLTLQHTHIVGLHIGIELDEPAVRCRLANIISDNN